MRKIIFLMHISLDGLVAGPNGPMDLGWVSYTNELEQFAHQLHETTDAAIYGRVTWEMMDSFWPNMEENPDSSPGDIAHSRWYNAATKYVISKTLDAGDRKNTVVIGDNLAEEFTKIKQQPGKDLWLLGSPSVARTFMQLGLIDEYRLTLNPIILGQGKPLFGELEPALKLKLIEAKTLDSGVVTLRYVPDTTEA